MSNNRIKLILEGMPRDEGHVYLNVFLDQLTHLNGALSTLDKIASGGRKSSDFAVVGLSHSSPATIEIEPRTRPKRPDVRAEIFNEFQRVYESIEQNRIPPDVDYALLDHLRQLTAPIGARLSRTAIWFDSSEFGFTEDTAHRINAYLAENEECTGTVEGTLERLNVHNDANVFTIYPDVGPKKVACHFSEEQLDKAISAIKRKVAVSGILQFRRDANFPHQVVVDQITTFPDDNELATVEDLFGIAPNATGDKSSEDFVKEIRCAWR